MDYQQIMLLADVGMSVSYQKEDLGSLTYIIPLEILDAFIYNKFSLCGNSLSQDCDLPLSW